MSLKSRLLAAFAAVALFAAACATQQSAQSASSSVEEVEEGGAATGTSPTASPTTPTVPFNRIEAPEGFVVKLPGQPQVVRNKVTLNDNKGAPIGDVVTAAWTSNVEGVIYSISMADYPERVVAARPPEAFIEEGKNGLVNQLKGTLKSEEVITINGLYPGKAYSVSSDNGEVRARNFLVGPRLYTLLVLFNPSIGAPGADQFLTSLELVNPPPPVERRRAGGSDGGSAGDGGMGGMGGDAGTMPSDAGMMTPDAGRRTK